METEKIVLAGGCFWCIEPVFKKINGVQTVICGYTGGITRNPTYEEVCTGETGHAEAIKIEYDKEIINLPTLLEVFFTIHDPTTLNRQGADIGTQYRSAIFYEDEEQRSAAENAISKTNKSRTWKNPIVTTLEPLTDFYEAEQYHQDFFTKNPNNRYCQLSITPKLRKFDELFKNLKQ